ncbi:MAG TPA: FecR domain-containing protein [Bacteroidaceae bacterium]|nr:FecR domain-containing protein [Bacteroidaceae bacterium]
MKHDLLQKYILGEASEDEKKQITEWIQESPDHMREYLAQRKLYDIALWQSKAMEEKPLNKRITFTLRSVVYSVARIAAMVAIVFLVAYYWGSKDTEKVAYQSVYVPAGQRAELMLADGTKVWLNSRSTLKFPTNFQGGFRNVILDGEGFFTVAKNKEIPFIVKTGKYDVKVLGTEFNVLAYSTDSVWETSLLEGSVEIQANGKRKLRLEPNTMVRLQENNLVKQHIKKMEYFRWREGLICFDNISVKEMIEKLKLYYGVDIVVNNREILGNRYTGKFRARDGIEHVLKVLRLNNRFTYEKDDEANRIIIN